MSVFISWAGPDRDVKNVIAARLQEEKIPYFNSDEHCASDFSDECIMNIRNSTVFLVIVSESSMHNSSYVINEVIEARSRENAGALNIIVYKITDEPYTPRFAFNLNHISDANHLTRVQKLGAESAIETLVKRIRHLEKLREAGNPEKPYDVLLPTLQGTLIATKSYLGYFVEGSREEKLTEMSEAFEGSSTVILSEFFGYGKRSLIKRHVVKEGYSFAIELDAMGASLYDFFLNGLTVTNVNPAVFDCKDEISIIKKKFDFLSRLDKRCLLVITDADLDGEPNETVVTLLGALKCRVAIITQSEAEEYRDYFTVLTLGRMSDEQLTDLFYHYYDRGGFADRESLTPLLHSFFEEISGHTKTVELAATVLAKEIHADVNAAKNYLTARNLENASLTDRITDRLSELIELERFTDAEKNVLLITALTASPSLDIGELRLILERAGLDANDVNTVIRLKDKRWISYNQIYRTVSIEPIIARLCVSKLMSSYAIVNACFERLAEVYSGSSSHTYSVLLTTEGRIERMLRLVSLSEAADVLRTIKLFHKGKTPDGEPNERFLSFFKSFMETYDAENERDAFVIKAAAWVLYMIMPSTEIFAKLPTQATDTDLDSALGQLGEDYAALANDPDVVDAISFINTADDDCRLQEILTAFSSLVLSADYENMETLIEEIFHMIDYSDALSDSESCDMITGIAKMFCKSAIGVGANRMALAFLERLIAYEFPAYHEHQLLVEYTLLLLGCDDPPQSPSEIMAMAEEKLEEAALGGNIDSKTLALARGDMLTAYAAALISEDDYDGAIDKLDELDSIGRLEATPTVINAIYNVATGFTLNGDRESAVNVAERYEDFLCEAASDDDLDETYRERAQSVLAFLISDSEMLGSDFGRGGIVENPSYYQKYSHDKKNGIFKMSKYRRVADLVKRFDFSDLTSDQILVHADKLRERAHSGEPMMNLAPEAFALVSEVGMRTLGYRHHYVQYVGAAAMLDGKIAEILNGEGKTYTITLTAFVYSLYSEKVLVLDNSQYLTERNYKWMRGLYSALGTKCRLIEPKDKYTHFIDDDGYCIGYASMATLGIAMMYRDNLFAAQRKDLSRYAIIIDEADTVLVEAAKSPFTLVDRSEQSHPEKVDAFNKAWELISPIIGDNRYYTRKGGRTAFSDLMRSLIEDSFGLSYGDVSDSVRLAEIERIVRQGLYCASLTNGVDYVIRGGAVFFENEVDGSLYEANAEHSFFLLSMAGAVTSVAEGRIRIERKTVNSIYTFAILSAFGRIAGTSATAASFKKEFADLYDLEVISIPTALPIQRIDRTVTLYTSIEPKDNDIVAMIAEKHERRQPVLLIVRNTAESVRYSRLLSDAGIKHGVLNASNSEKSPELLAGAGKSGSVLIATQLANRGVDIKLGGDPERATIYELIRMGFDITELNDMLYTIPTEQTLESDIYRKYTALLSLNKQRAAIDRDAVIASGGLTVISSEPHDNMRVEQQIRGRAGRQGAIGESYIFESIDDPTYASMIPTSVINRFKSMMGDETVINAAFLIHSLEKAKERQHHRTFALMRSGKALSARIERSRAHILSLISDKYDGQTIEQLIELWANDPVICAECEKLAEGYKVRDDSFIARVSVSRPYYLENIDGEDTAELLTALAKKSLDGTALTPEQTAVLLTRLLRGAFADHLTQIQKNDRNDTWNGVKHSEKFYLEKYKESLNRAIISATDTWLRLLIDAVPKTRPTVVRRTPERNAPCPCGSGRKYKSCCGAQSDSGES